MPIFADLHIHGKYSRAVSKNMLIPNLEKYARIKGIGLLGTGDSQHPQWNAHLKEHLVKEKDGIYYTKIGFPFILSTEISLVYTQNEKGRRVHLILLFPSFSILEQFTAYLLSKGRIDYDGRPIFKIPSDVFVHDVKAISDTIEIIPAHIWTPWFSLFGSKSGFDTITACFGKETKHIYALETGLSSDPPMNWRLSQLDRFTLVSFSDSHSIYPWRIGREATILDIPLTYAGLITALRTKKGYVGTVEVDPCYGKYHFDGHRKCAISMAPKKGQDTCPVCKKKMTIGVLHRVEELADRPNGYTPPNPALFHRVLPLHELIAVSVGQGVKTKKVQDIAQKLLSLAPELDILLTLPIEKIKKAASSDIISLILQNRKGQLAIEPGYDGEYGKIQLETHK
ncbi:MAG: endonuclease Q family protein [Nanoarchaeota archaeon]